MGSLELWFWPAKLLRALVREALALKRNPDPDYLTVGHVTT